MKRFQFPLQPALDWRERLCDAEESRLRSLQNEETRLAQERDALERELRVPMQAIEVTGADLHRRAAHTSAVMTKVAHLGAEIIRCQARVEAQKSAWVEARRQVRMLEKLKERRHGEWKATTEREMEALSAETFLANWTSRNC